MSEKQPFFIETPLHSIAETETELVIIEQFKWKIKRPFDSYALLDDPTVREAHDRDEYMPYWADIWPASRMLGKAIAREDWSKWQPPEGKLQALELGCGLGIPGLTALGCGLAVTFTDYDLAALQFVEQNARLNKLTDYRTMPLDWRCPPPGLTFPIILGADLTYEERNIEPLIDLILTILAPGGMALLTDQDRTPAPLLRQRLAEKGLKYTQTAMKAGEPGGYRVQGSLYRITRR